MFRFVSTLSTLALSAVLVTGRSTTTTTEVKQDNKPTNGKGQDSALRVAPIVSVKLQKDEGLKLVGTKDQPASKVWLRRDKSGPLMLFPSNNYTYEPTTFMAWNKTLSLPMLVVKQLNDGAGTFQLLPENEDAKKAENYRVMTLARTAADEVEFRFYHTLADYDSAAFIEKPLNKFMGVGARNSIAQLIDVEWSRKYNELKTKSGKEAAQETTNSLMFLLRSVYAVEMGLLKDASQEERYVAEKHENVKEFNNKISFLRTTDANLNTYVEEYLTMLHKPEQSLDESVLKTLEKPRGDGKKDSSSWFPVRLMKPGRQTSNDAVPPKPNTNGGDKKPDPKEGENEEEKNGDEGKSEEKPESCWDDKCIRCLLILLICLAVVGVAAGVALVCLRKGSTEEVEETDTDEDSEY